MLIPPSPQLISKKFDSRKKARFFLLLEAFPRCLFLWQADKSENGVRKVRPCFATRSPLPSLWQVTDDLRNRVKKNFDGLLGHASGGWGFGLPGLEGLGVLVFRRQRSVIVGSGPGARPPAETRMA